MHFSYSMVFTMFVATCDGTTISGDCYVVPGTKTTYEAAETDCVSKGGHLADFQDQATLDAVESMWNIMETWYM